MCSREAHEEEEEDEEGKGCDAIGGVPEGGKRAHYETCVSYLCRPLGSGLAMDDSMNPRALCGC